MNLYTLQNNKSALSPTIFKTTTFTSLADRFDEWFGNVNLNSYYFYETLTPSYKVVVQYFYSQLSHPYLSTCAQLCITYAVANITQILSRPYFQEQH